MSARLFNEKLMREENGDSFLMCMDLLKTILCCNFNFELVTKAWTRQGKHVRDEVKVFLDSNTFP